MSNSLNSLTVVTKEEVSNAVDNHRRQKELHLAEYHSRLDKWWEGYQGDFTWWQRKVRHLDRMSGEELLIALHGKGYVMGVVVEDETKVGLGLWDKSFLYTLGRYGSKWARIAYTLETSGKDEHMVREEVMEWIMDWSHHKMEYSSVEQEGEIKSYAIEKQWCLKWGEEGALCGDVHVDILGGSRAVYVEQGSNEITLTIKQAIQLRKILEEVG